MIKISEALNWILRIFLIVVGIILIYQLLRKILGGSWEMETFLITLVIANAGYSFYLGNQISELRGWSQQFEKRLEEKFTALEKRFDTVAADFKPHPH